MSNKAAYVRGESCTVPTVGRIGWLDEAYCWAEDGIGPPLAGKETVKQQNIGGALQKKPSLHKN